jgi:hypothetical protein
MCNEKNMIEPPPDPPGIRKFTNRDMRDALYANYGNVRRAAQQLGVFETSLWQRIDKNKEKWTQIINDARRQIISLAESELIKKVRKGDSKSIIFALKTLGKDHGYIERTEITGAEGVDLMTKITVEIVEREK